MPRIAKKTRILRLIAERGWSRIDHAEWTEIQAAVEGVSATDLHSIDIPVEPPWSGIRQHTFEELRDSLLALSAVYGNRPELQTFCRNVVIAAKNRARAAARSRYIDDAKRSAKLEMAEWMLIWLGDPAIFPVWVSVRIAHLSTFPVDPP